MPLIADNIIIYLYRMIVLLVLEYRSMDWVTTEGTVVNSRSPEHEMYPYAEIEYTYRAEGTSHYGTYKHGFWHSDSAEDFASLYPRSRKIVVRYNPTRHYKSFLCERDQTTKDGVNSTANADELGPTKTRFGDW